MLLYVCLYVNPSISFSVMVFFVAYIQCQWFHSHNCNAFIATFTFLMIINLPYYLSISARLDDLEEVVRTSKYCKEKSHVSCISADETDSGAQDVNQNGVTLEVCSFYTQKIGILKANWQHYHFLSHDPHERSRI